MNFDFDEDQRYLKDEARRFLAAHSPITAVRRVLDDPALTHDVALWQAIAAQGWTGAALPEAQGGLGLGQVTLCALAEEMGRALAPTPFASSLYRFADAIGLAGDQDMWANLLPGIADGSLIGTVALAEGPGDPLVAPIGTKVEAGRLYGAKRPVVDGSIAQVALVLATDSEGPGLWLVRLDGACVACETLPSLDPTRDLAHLRFDGAPATPLTGGMALVQQIEERAAVPIAFEQLGGAERCLEMARDYALERHAYGRPIGSYQAIKHRLVEMAMKIEVARVHAYHAAWALETGAPELPRAAAAARIAAGDAYWFAAKESIHIHGGIGFTWEMDCHLHYRRAQFLNLMLGPPARWKRRLADLIDPRQEGAHGL